MRNLDSDKLFLHAVPQNIQMWVIVETVVVKQTTVVLSLILYHWANSHGFLSLYSLHEGQNIRGPLAA
jgi:hypothetical protein